MTPEKVLEVIEIYRQFFIENNINKIDYAHDKLLDDKINGLEHCHSKLDQMIIFVHQNRMEKVFRWLGFIQGLLWSNRIYTLADLKNHSRPRE